MRVLVLGGTGFIGPWLVRDLRQQAHEVVVFHRGNASLPEGAKAILGDRKRLRESERELRSCAPDIVIDLILSSAAQATELMDIFRGVAQRVIVASSLDVYRAFAVLHGIDKGALQELPLTEESELRTTPAYSPDGVKMMESLFGWVDDDYDKVPAERIVMSDPDLPGTVLRLPFVYGPGDPLHRLLPILKRVDDGRQRLVFSDDVARWRGPRGYVENVAAAIALATTSEKAKGRTYNVCEETAFAELDWWKKVAGVAGWSGETVVVSAERAPHHLRIPANLEQQWSASSERIRKELGYREPVPLEEAIRRTIAWERANPPAQIDARQFDYDAEDAAA